MPPGRSESRDSGTVLDDAFEPVIGLEIHVQLATRTKMFCRCAYHYGAEANTQVCPVCLGYPGALPVPNRQAIDHAVRLALALGAAVHERSAFDRKSYVYPDLPKGYQITQHDRPLATGGSIPLSPDLDAADESAPGPPRTIPLARLHLEEDAGKLVHATDEEGEADTLIDFNRCGVPLVELVTLPTLHSPAEARDLLQVLRRLVRWLGVSDASMEEGSLRCDANLSLRPRGQDALGTKVEIKNLNSFRHVAQALAHEMARQEELLARGARVVEETRGFDAVSGSTYPQRSKEGLADYRYFPEPDLPPLVVSAERQERLRATLPELPWTRRDRLAEDHDLPLRDASALTETRDLADYVEQALATPATAGDARDDRGPTDEARRVWDGHGDGDRTRSGAIASWVRTEVLGELHRRVATVGEASGEPETGLAAALPARHLAALVDRVRSGQVSHSAAKEVLAAIWGTGETPAAAIERLGLTRVDDPARLRTWVEEVLAANPDQVARYLDGKRGLAEFFVGRVMARSSGRAAPHRVRALLEAALEERRTEPALSP